MRFSDGLLNVIRMVLFKFRSLILSFIEISIAKYSYAVSAHPFVQFSNWNFKIFCRPLFYFSVIISQNVFIKKNRGISADVFS